MQIVFGLIFLIFSSSMAMAAEATCTLVLSDYKSSIGELAQGYIDLEKMNTEGANVKAASAAFKRELDKKRSALVSLVGQVLFEAEFSRAAKKLSQKSQTKEVATKTKRAKKLKKEIEKFGVWKIKHHIIEPVDIGSSTWSPDGQRIAIPSKSGVTVIIDAETGKIVAHLVGHAKKVYQAVWSADGQRIVTRSEDLVTKVWDANTGEFLFDLQNTFRNSRSVVMLAEWSPSGEFIITSNGDGNVDVWSGLDGSHTKKLQTNELTKTKLIYDVEWAADGLSFLTASESGDILLWDPLTWEPTLLFPAYHLVRNVEYNLKESHVLVNADDYIYLVNVKTKKQIRLDYNGGRFKNAQYTRDGKKVVSLNGDNKISVWNAKTYGEPIKQFSSHELGELIIAETIDLHPNDQIVAVAQNDGTIRLLNIETGIQEQKLEGHTKRVYSISFNPDGTKLLSVSNDGTLIIWGIESSGLEE